MSSRKPSAKTSASSSPFATSTQKVPVAIAANPQQLPSGAAPEEKRTGETTTARQLLRSDELNLLNCTVSGDALYANDENARLIVQEKGGDYLFTAHRFCLCANPVERHPFIVSGPESRNGEVIERQLAVEPVRSESICFPHALSVMCAERVVTHKKSGIEKAESRHFISSLQLTRSTGTGQASPVLFATLIRGHWTVENNIHWLREAVGFEDRCRSRDPNAACALALLRTALIAPLRAAGHLSVTRCMEDLARNPGLAVTILLRQRLASPNW